MGVEMTSRVKDCLSLSTDGRKDYLPRLVSILLSCAVCCELCPFECSYCVKQAKKTRRCDFHTLFSTSSQLHKLFM